MLLYILFKLPTNMGSVFVILLLLNIDECDYVHTITPD